MGTFTLEKIEELKTFFKRNAAAPVGMKKNCIEVLNAGVESIYENSTPALGTLGSAIHETMAILKELGHVSNRRVIEFRDNKNQITHGEDRPYKLDNSIMDVMWQMIDGEPGRHVFGLSIMDGYHSVMLVFLNVSPPHREPLVFWADQWNWKRINCLGGTRKFGGWKNLNRENLDAVVTELTQRWWDMEPNMSKKSKTRTTIWRLNPPENRF